MISDFCQSKRNKRKSINNAKQKTSHSKPAVQCTYDEFRFQPCYALETHISIQFICTTDNEKKKKNKIRTATEIKTGPAHTENWQTQNWTMWGRHASTTLNESIDWICNSKAHTHTQIQSQHTLARSGQMEWRINDYERENRIRKPPLAIIYLRFLFRLCVSFIFHLNKLPITRLFSFSFFCIIIVIMILRCCCLFTLLLLLASFLSI